jgi:hypothetical protein
LARNGTTGVDVVNFLRCLRQNKVSGDVQVGVKASTLNIIIRHDMVDNTTESAITGCYKHAAHNILLMALINDHVPEDVMVFADLQGCVGVIYTGPFNEVKRVSHEEDVDKNPVPIIHLEQLSPEHVPLTRDETTGVDAVNFLRCLHRNNLDGGTKIGISNATLNIIINQNMADNGTKETIGLCYYYSGHYILISTIFDGIVPENVTVITDLYGGVEEIFKSHFNKIDRIQTVSHVSKTNHNVVHISTNYRPLERDGTIGVDVVNFLRCLRHNNINGETQVGLADNSLHINIKRDNVDSRTQKTIGSCFKHAGHYDFMLLASYEDYIPEDVVLITNLYGGVGSIYKYQFNRVGRAVRMSTDPKATEHPVQLLTNFAPLERDGTAGVDVINLLRCLLHNNINGDAQVGIMGSMLTIMFERDSNDERTSKTIFSCYYHVAPSLLFSASYHDHIPEDVTVITDLYNGGNVINKDRFNRVERRDRTRNRDLRINN